MNEINPIDFSQLFWGSANRRLASLSRHQSDQKHSPQQQYFAAGRPLARKAAKKPEIEQGEASPPALLYHSHRWGSYRVLPTQPLMVDLEV